MIFSRKNRISGAGSLFKADLGQGRRQGSRCADGPRQPGCRRIFDIALGGFSFLNPNDSDLPGSEIRMDILLFETKNNVELFISQARTRILWRRL